MTENIDKIAQDALDELLNTDDTAMQEEIVKLDVSEETNQEKEISEDTSDLSDVEKEAFKQGWRPDGGDKTAEEFIRDGQLIERIKEKGAQLKKLEKKMASLESYNKMMTDNLNQIKENAVREALEKLEAEREDAIATGDVDEVRKLDKAIEEKKESQTSVIPEVETFKAKYSNIFNPNTDDIIEATEALQVRQFLENADKLLASKNLSPEQHLATLEEAMLKKYGNSSLFAENDVSEDSPETVHKEEETVKAVIPSVSSGKSVSTRSEPRKITLKDLSHEQKQMCRDIVEEGIMTEEMFIEGLRLAGQIKAK